MTEEVMLQEAIGAIRNGQRERARDLLTRLLRSDQDNPDYWLWMSAVVDSDKERIYCLKNVLRLDPENATAKRGLIFMGAMPPEETRKTAAPTQRKWVVKLESERHPAIKINWTHQTIRVTGLLVATFLVIALILAGIFWPEKKAIPLPTRPTKTPGPPPTYTSTPTYIGYMAPTEPTATLSTPSTSSLWMDLEATYTPTALYVNTPHAINEAYRSGILAFEKGDWQSALEYFQQAQQVEPTSPDLQYYIGETQRMQSNFNPALVAYNRAITIDKYFAPAYLGRARARAVIDPKADVIADLNEAIANDPYLGEAYLERAAYWLKAGDQDKAEKDLKSAQSLLPDSPLTYAYLAQLALQQEDYTQAYSLAQKALELDQTSLDTYWLLSQAALSKGECKSASEALKVYLNFRKNDAQAWLASGKADAGMCSQEQVYESLVQPDHEGDYPAASKALDKALELDSRLDEISLYQGIINLVTGEGQSAINDLLLARKQLAPLPGASGEPDPLWFAVNIGLSRALYIAQRYSEASGQLEYAKNLAANDSQKAIVFYWRAQVSAAMNEPSLAMKDWKALLALPATAYPQDWALQAKAQVATLTAPTLTPTPTRTLTLTPRPSPSPTRTPLLTRTPTPTRTSRPSSSPVVTGTTSP